MMKNKKIRLSNNLKALRAISGDTQTSVSNKLNITRAAYANWEQGYGTPTFEMLIKLSSYYNVKLDVLVFGEISFSKN